MTATSSPEIHAFLIADVRGYTRFTVERGDEAAARLATRFSELVSEAVVSEDGQVLELRGDEALATFTSARRALRGAVAVQEAAARHSELEPDLPISVGIGVDAGEAVPVLGGFRGQALNLAARLCSLAGAGEVLATESLTHLAGRLEGLEYAPRGSVQLKGFAEPIEVVTVDRTRGATSIEPSPERVPIGAYLGALPAGPLSSREQERATIMRAIDVAQVGDGRTLLLAGEPGAGKTRLAQEATLELRNRGFAIGVGSCLETRQAVPYLAFLDALPALVAIYARSSSHGLDKWPYLARLLGVGPAISWSTTAADAEEERLRREVTSFLVELSRRQPVAVLIDDLHWSDDAGLQLTHHLSRHLRSERVLLLATYRDVEVRREHALEAVLRNLRREDLAEIMPVRRLGPEGTAAMVAASFDQERVSDEFAELIHRQTDGNPFFIQQVLRALVERGDIYPEHGGWERRELVEIEVPDSVRSTLEERVARLPEPSREALTVASVLGQSFHFDDLLAMIEQAEDALEDSLETAVASGLLRRDGRDSYAFDHALARQTLLGNIPTRRRRRLHALAAAALEEPARRSPERAVEVANHHMEAEHLTAAADWYLAAGDHAQRVTAHGEAETHYAMAARLALEAHDADRVARSGLALELCSAPAGTCTSRWRPWSRWSRTTGAKAMPCSKPGPWSSASRPAFRAKRCTAASSR
jgi:class 3 adenylate cyclase